MYEREEVQKFLATRVARPSSAGIILENAAGEALLLKAHYKPYWSFPGGWVEDGQTPREAALRELYEETGIELVARDVSFAYMVDRISEIMHTYQFMFRATAPVEDTSQIVLQASEIAEWRFVSPQTVMADLSNYGGAVQVWARGDTSGYAEEPIPSAV